MLGIKVNDEFLYLPEDFSFQIEENNPMLTEDAGDYTKIPGRAPRCPINDKILSFWADIDRASVSNPEPDAVIYDVNPEYYGSLVFVSANEKYYEFYFKGNRAKFNAALKALNLNDMDYSEQISNDHYQTIYMGYDLKDYVLNFYPNQNLTFFPVYMPSAEFEFDDTKNKFINFWNMENDCFDSNWAAADNINMICPFFYMKFVIEKICEELGYLIDYNYFDQEDIFDQIVIFNTNYNLYYDGLSGSYASFVRDLPSTTAYELIKAIEEYFNVTFYANEQKNIVNIQLNDNVITGKNVIDITDYAISDFRKENRKYNGIQINPNIDIDDSFINDDINTEDFIEIDGEVDHEDDLPSLSEENIYYLVKEKNWIYKRIQNYEGNYTWESIGHNYIKYKEGNNILLTKNLRASTLMMYYDTTDYKPIPSAGDYANVVIPRCDIERKNTDNMYENKNGKIKFLIYRGFVHAMYTMIDENSKYEHIGTVEDETDIPSWNGGGTFGSLPSSDYKAGADAASSTKVYVLNSDKTYYIKDLGGSTYQWTQTSNISGNGVPWNSYPFGTSSYYYVTGSAVPQVVEKDTYKFTDAWLTMHISNLDGIIENFYPKFIYWLNSVRETGYMDFMFPKGFKIDFTEKYRIQDIDYLIESRPVKYIMQGKEISKVKLVRV